MLLGYFHAAAPHDADPAPGEDRRGTAGRRAPGPLSQRPFGLAASLLAQAAHRFAAEPAIATFGGGAFGIACAGTIRRAEDGGGGALIGRVLAGHDLLGAVARHGPAALRDERADGHFALAWYDATRGTLTLGRDPFGARRLCYARLDGALWFADDPRALLALPHFRARRGLDLPALHTYLAFSFVAAPHTPILGIAAVPPNTALRFAAPDAAPQPTPLLLPPGRADHPPDDDEIAWSARWQAEFDAAMGRWSAGLREAAVHLSGGLDSALVAAWLARSGIRTRLCFFDFGPPHDAERPHAEAVAAWLGLPLERIAVSPRRFGAARALRDLGDDLGEPWGDPVALPLRLGYRAAREAGLPVVFNGEGGDQLLAGWPNRPMLAGELYADRRGGERERLARYLRTFHHFHGLEGVAYTPRLRAAAGDEALTALVGPYLTEPALPDLFDRLRWANYWLKGAQNILPRAAALSQRAGVALATPLFDRRLARFALTIPPGLLLRGNEEKHLVKQALRRSGDLPPSVIDRPKRGMGVPATAWCLGPLRNAVRGLLRRLARRDLLRPDYLRHLARGAAAADELRGARRLGEQLWQLAMLEVWLEVVYDSDR